MSACIGACSLLRLYVLHVVLLQERAVRARGQACGIHPWSCWHGCWHSRGSYPLEEVVVACHLEERQQFRDRDPSDSHHPRDHGEVVESMVRLVPLLAP